MLLLDDEDELPLEAGPEEVQLAADLGPVGLQAIDTNLLACADVQWLKGARIVSEAMKNGGFAYDDDCTDLHVRRLIGLVDRGVLEGQGNLRKPRWSEVRRNASQLKP